MSDILLTCPPMIHQLDHFAPIFADLGWQVHVPEFQQALSEDELIQIVPAYDGWIIGDDPASRIVVEAGRRGRLRAAVKWGVGTDNVDFEAFSEQGIPVTNTPGMFGREVADVAIGYVIALARHTFEIDRQVRSGDWPKPTGISLAERKVALIGFGDIGRNTAKRLAACEMRIAVCDPAIPEETVTKQGFEHQTWPQCLADADFVVFTCALTPESRHMLNEAALTVCKPGIRVINVARGLLIDERALLKAQVDGVVSACALDVFEDEPLKLDHPLRDFSSNVFGSHNASNTIDGVIRTSRLAIDHLHTFLDGSADRDFAS
jgi:D-3-phosphoglycerate dehydrogenase